MDTNLNFLCISNYNNNLDWVRDYPNHIIYDKTWNGGLLNNDTNETFGPTNLQEKYPEYNIVNSSINGYNIYDYLTYIVDHYDNLPEVVVFCKGNTFPRHLSENKFRELIKSKCFTPIEDWTYHDQNQPSLQTGVAMWSSDGGFMEINSSWYLNLPNHPIKYFSTYNDFIQYCFVDPVLPRYVRFPPGGNFVVPKEYIHKYDRTFYRNLRLFVEHTRVPGEGQLIERALYTIWMCNYKVTESMKTDLSKLIQ